ncbi:cutinase-domain-containing protein [Geopyxis carbonaria]|nr:cutinase-domain-containing protein [Geopyxis carbonaria]
MKLAVILSSTAIIFADVSLAQSCAESVFLFARGTGEIGDIGSTVGVNMRTSLRRALGSRMEIVGVEYPAGDDFEESSAEGARWVVNYVKTEATRCPELRFAFGGYSQGCQVFHKARAGLADENLQAKFVGATLWGDPYMMAAGTLSRVPKSWAGKILDNCAVGDPVCGGGDNLLAHIIGYTGTYTRAAEFLEDRLNGESGNAKSDLHGNDKNLPDYTSSLPAWGL